MTPISRRTFLGSAAAAGAGLGLGAIPGVAGTARAATGTLADAAHIVILMQENRSFDHYFGMLNGVRGFGDRATIQLPGGHSVFDQPNGAGRQYPWQFSATAPAGGADPERLAQCSGDLDHSWTTQHAAWNTGRMDSWVAAKGSVRTLGHLTAQDIPFHYALASTWTICDAYHASGLTATGPNRTYLWSGTIDSTSKDGGDESGLTWQTYAEALEKAGVSWKVYQASDNYGDNGLAYFKQFANAPAGSPLRTKGMATVPSGATDPGDVAADIADAIAADVRAGTLPQVSWIVPNQNYSEHPYATPANGAHFVHLVLQALNADPDVFNSTILFLNYDENDGFFDHVPPPVPPAGTAGESFSGVPIGLGFRVPMIAVSPWSRGGWVSSEVSDHTSVLRFLEQWTAAIGKPATCPNISAWRRAVCGDLTGLFDFASPVPGLPQLPETSGTVDLADCSALPNPAPVANRLPVQASGARQARALPYQPAACLDHLEFGANGVAKVWLALANQGVPARRSAHFAVYANAFRTGGPWQYTIAPGGSTTDYFNCGTGFGNGAYDLTVTGPNRFLCRFQGDATKPGKDLRVSTSYAVESGTGRLALWFAFANSSGSAMTVTVTSTAYRGDGPWSYTVPAGGKVTDYFNAVAYNDGWYDFTVTTSADLGWSQRFTGHLETGAPSVTG